MNAQIYSIILSQSKLKQIDIFGYTTKGLPGLEIKGHKKWTDGIREKIVYLTRSRGLRIPLKRYVLVISDYDLAKESKEKNDYSFLEAPLLIMYWYLGGKIPIHQLNDCICCGRVSIKGKILMFSIPEFFLQKINNEIYEQDRMGVKLITSQKDKKVGHYPIIPMEDLLEGIPQIEIGPYELAQSIEVKSKFQNPIHIKSNVSNLY